MMTDWLGLPALASAHGGQVDSLIGWMHVFMLILFVGWGGFFVYALMRFRRSRNPVADYAGVKSHRSAYLEIGVAVVEGVLLFGFAIPLWAARVDARPPEHEAMVVHVTGEQFAWNIHYPGPDRKFGRTDIKLLDLQTNPLGLDRTDPAGKDDVTTLNQLYLPVNRPVIVRLRSKDVIHSFGVPEFRVKQDAIPGLTIPLWAARVDRMPPENEALVVQVTAEQFAWNVRYPGPDGVFGRTDINLINLQDNPLGLDRSDPAAKDDITTLNQLYLPANKPIIVKLRSKDVIHSFGVPEFRVKQDAIPGLTIPVWFIPNVTTAEMRSRTGNPEFQYEIACAQLCGLGHYRMRGFVTIQSAEEFQTWMDEKVKEQAEAASDPFR
jgi:cytochrome c oxidase subunit 2